MKRIIKLLTLIIGVSGANLPFAYAITSPEHGAWYFYVSMGGFFGGAVLVLMLIAYKLLNELVD